MSNLSTDAVGKERSTGFHQFHDGSIWISRPWTLLYQQVWDGSLCRCKSVGFSARFQRGLEAELSKSAAVVFALPQRSQLWGLDSCARLELERYRENLFSKPSRRYVGQAETLAPGGPLGATARVRAASMVCPTPHPSQWCMGPPR